MKASEKVACIYAVAVVSAGLFSFVRGRRDAELFADSAIHGAIVGTVGTAVFLLAFNQEQEVAQNPARSMGKLSDRGVALLAGADERMFKPLRENGVTVELVPKDPNVVVQDEY